MMVMALGEILLIKNAWWIQNEIKFVLRLSIFSGRLVRFQNNRIILTSVTERYSTFLLIIFHHHL